MLIKYKERYRLLFRTIAIVTISLFLYNDIAFALAPKLRTVAQEDFKLSYQTGYTLLAHNAINTFIRDYISSGIEASKVGELKIKPAEDVDESQAVVINGRVQSILIIAIPDLLKKTGQFAHIGLGGARGMPVIYIDKKYFYKNELREHEKNKIGQWEGKRERIGFKTYRQMREWILSPLTRDEAKEFADKVDRETKPGVKKLYEGVAKDYIDLDTIYTFYSDYGLDKDNNDINIAAHEAGENSERQRLAASWVDENVPELKGKTVFSLSMEGNIPEFGSYTAHDANTKGGLGVYFGDKLEGMAAIGINAFGAQIGYSHVRKDGGKIQVSYNELIEKGILQKVFVGNDAVMVRAWDEDPEARCADEEDPCNPKVAVEVYKVNRGGATDYIFMSKVFDELYPDDRVHRFTQEIVFGKAVYAFMRKTGFIPDILHMNEAHTVVAAAQMRADEMYDKTAIVYTNHTIVPAGLEIFSSDCVRSNVDRMMYVIGLPEKSADKFRSIFLRPDGVVDFCYAAIKLADVITAVSREHALKTMRLFQGMYGGEFNTDVVGILNGSGQTWKSDRLLKLESSGRVPDLNDSWAIHEAGKAQAFAELEKRTGIKLDPHKPTVWAIRRLVEYKSQYPALKFIVHLMTADRTRSFTRDELKDIWFRDLANFRQDYERNYMGSREIAESILDKLFPSGVERVNGLGMQVIVGWPAPAYQKFWADEFYRWMDLPDLKGRFAALLSDTDILKMQAIGADICLTMPRPLEEACGTSDQRTGLNFGVNIAIKGAGPAEWIEEYDETRESGSGFLIGPYTIENGNNLDPDNEKFYKEVPVDIFEKAAVCSRLFYEEAKGKWKRLMLNSYLRANEIVTAMAMEKRYALGAYLPAIRKKAIIEPTAAIKELDGKILVNTDTGRIKFAGSSHISDPQFEFWAVRHGETNANKEGRFQGAVDEPQNQLNEEGIRQAQNAAEELFENLKDKIRQGKVVVLTSQSGRAKTTAGYFLKTVETRLGISIAPVEEPLLNEIAYGVWENKREEELSRDQIELVGRYRRGLDATVRAEGGESFIDLLIRSKLLVDKLNQKYKDKDVVIFGSGAQIRATKIVLGDRSMIDDNGYIDWRSKGQAVPNAKPIRLFAFPEVMFSPDEDYTKTLMNAAIGEMARRPVMSSIETVKMAILHQMNMPAVVPENKILWHIIEKDVIPEEQQQNGFVTRINKAFRENKDVMEKIWVLDDKKAIAEAIADIRKDDPNAVIDIALGNESRIESIPDDKEIKMLVFKAKDFIQLEGVVAALRALHSDNALPALLRIYSVMAGKPFNNPPDAISDDPKEFARRLIFDLPRAASAPIDDISKMNERLLQLLTAA